MFTSEAWGWARIGTSAWVASVSFFFLRFDCFGWPVPSTCGAVVLFRFRGLESPPPPSPSPSLSPSPSTCSCATPAVWSFDFGVRETLRALGVFVTACGGCAGPSRERSSATVLCMGVCSYVRPMDLLDFEKAIVIEPRQSNAGRPGFALLASYRRIILLHGDSYPCEQGPGCPLLPHAPPVWHVACSMLATNFCRYT